MGSTLELWVAGGTEPLNSVELTVPAAGTFVQTFLDVPVIPDVSLLGRDWEIRLVSIGTGTGSRVVDFDLLHDHPRTGHDGPAGPGRSGDAAATKIDTAVTWAAPASPGYR